MSISILRRGCGALLELFYIMIDRAVTQPVPLGSEIPTAQDKPIRQMSNKERGARYSYQRYNHSYVKPLVRSLDTCHHPRQPGDSSLRAEVPIHTEQRAGRAACQQGCDTGRAPVRRRPLAQPERRSATAHSASARSFHRQRRHLAPYVTIDSQSTAQPAGRERAISGALSPGIEATQEAPRHEAHCGFARAAPRKEKAPWCNETLAALSFR